MVDYHDLDKIWWVVASTIRSMFAAIRLLPVRYSWPGFDCTQPMCDKLAYICRLSWVAIKVLKPVNACNLCNGRTAHGHYKCVLGGCVYNHGRNV